MTMPIQPPIAVGPPAPPGMGNEPNPQGGFTTPVAGTQPPDGSQLDKDVAVAQAAVTESQKAIDAAQGNYDKLYEQFQQAMQAANDPGNVNAADQLRAAQAAFDTAQKDLASAHTAAANAQARVVAAAEQAASRAKDPDLKDYYQAHAAQAQSQVAVNNANIAALKAKTPAEVAQVQAQTQQALAQAQATGVLAPAQAAQAMAQATQLAAQASQITALLPSATRTAAAQATTAEAQAGVAPQAAQAAVQKAQADVQQAQANVEQLRRQIANMPSTEQAQAAINLGLQSAEADLQAKQQAVEQARQLMPLAIGQAGANIQATQANTVATLAAVGQKTLGPLYGIGDQISKLRDMIASGSIQPQDAQTALDSYLNTQLTGATPFQRAQETNTYNLSNRTLDVNQANARLNAGASFAGNTLGTFGQLAAGAGPGFGPQMAAGFQAALNMGRQFFGQMGGLQNTPAAPSAMTQVPQVHINIGGGAPTSAPQPSQPALPAPAAALPNPGTPSISTTVPALPAAPTPQTPDSFLSDWQQRQAADAAAQQAAAGIDMSGGASSGIPAFASGGIVSSPTIALIGEAGPEAVIPLGHPAVQQAAMAVPHSGVIESSPWLQHIERWKQELVSGQVQHTPNVARR